MKLLYLTPKINEEGGVQKVLSVRTNYFIEKLHFRIDILTQNSGNTNLFFEFNSKIGLHDMLLKGNAITKLLSYKKQIEKHIQLLQPDFIIVCDFGLKAFLIPFLITTNIPIIFEAHGSLYNEPTTYRKGFINAFSRKLKYAFRKFSAKRFDYFVALSNQSLLEWQNSKGIVIPNPISNNSEIVSSLNSKKVIVVARHSYEKGLDRLLPIWKMVAQKHPNWQLEIYGKIEKEIGLEKLVFELEMEQSVLFCEPVKNIQEKYLDASIFVMTSRSEGFPMVLLEAMSCGLPIIAYDCPIGPRAIVTHIENGFLIPDGNETLFAEKLIELIENQSLRIEMGKNAKISCQKYDIDMIMNTWNDLFEDLKNRNN
jgi:glycosyltransferase involved in cell wall biosynthesis